MYRIGNKLVDVCDMCGKIVRIDKPMLGSLHFCSTEEERALFSDVIRWRVQVTKAELDRAMGHSR